MRNGNARVFVMSTVASACMFWAAHFVGAGSEADTQDAAPALARGTATMDGCEISGELLRKADGVYAVFNAANTTDSEATLAFNYVVAMTPGASPAMRMIPMPKEIKRDSCTLKVGPKGSASTEVLVAGGAAAPQPSAKADSASEKEQTGRSPNTWTLVISRDEAKVPAGAGAVTPAVPAGKTPLHSGSAVLASFSEPEPTPDTQKKG